MSTPSVKGLLIIPMVHSISEALSDGTLSREQLEVALEREDIALLDEKLESTRWYPVATLGRMTELLAALAGGDRATALREIGAAGATLVRDEGIYRQMDFEDGAIRDADQFALRSFTRGAATLHQMMFNFGKTRVEIDETDSAVLIHYEDVAAYPEATRLSSEGYSTAMSSRALGRPCQVRVERIRPDSFTLRFSS